MDDLLLLGLIANQKKMARSGSSGSSAHVREAIQILEAKAMSNEMVKSYPKEFGDFLTRNIDEIIRTFEARLTSQ
jgi:hypothetical protein